MSPSIRTVPRRLAAVALLFLCACSATAAAQVEIGGGVSLTRGNEDTPVVSAAWLPVWREYRGGMLHWDLGAIHLRARSGSAYANDHHVTVFHGGLRYERPSGLVGGFGIGVQSGSTQALSGSPQFVSSLGWRWDRFSLLARHVSNASLRQPNDGETMLLGTWRF